MSTLLASAFQVILSWRSSSLGIVTGMRNLWVSAPGWPGCKGTMSNPIWDLVSVGYAAWVISQLPTTKFNLAMLHSSVNWHLHCCCEVFQSVLEAYLCTGCIPPGFLQNPYLYLYPWAQVQVFWGTGVGSPGKPQGYLCQSLFLSAFMLGDSSKYQLLWQNISITQLWTHPISITLRTSPHTVNDSMIPICPHLCPNLHLSTKPWTWTQRLTPRLFTLVTAVLFVFLVWLLLLLYSPIVLLSIVVICV